MKVWLWSWQSRFSDVSLTNVLYYVSLQKSLMVIGIDVYHDKARQGKSVAGFVASLNKHCTRWFSTVAYHEPGQELVKGLQICLTDALRKYNEVSSSGRWDKFHGLMQNRCNSCVLIMCRWFSTRWQ